VPLSVDALAMISAVDRRLRSRARPRPARCVAAALIVIVGGGACGSSPHSQGGSRPAWSAALGAALDGWRASGDPATGVEIPAACAAVILEDGRIHSAASGRAGDLHDGGETSPDAVFRLASVTKLFTATVVMQLAQEAKLSVDDPISRWVSFPDGDRITVAMLMSHTSGIPNLSDDLNHRDWTPQELVDGVAARGERDFEPGASWAYSNTAYVLLGMIVERVSGRTWQDEVRSRIVEPLGLRTVHAYRRQEGPEPIPGYDLHCIGEDGQGASETECIGRASTAAVVVDSYDWKYAWAAGALVANAADVATFLRALVAGDLLDASHRARMLTPVPATVAYMKDAYARSGERQLVMGVGLGPWLFDVEGVGRAWGHGGSIPGFNNSALYYPELGFGAVVLNNLFPAGRAPFVPGASAVGTAAVAMLASE
jgi:D-alanyl-D-alanine carboxypeptidase